MWCRWMRLPVPHWGTWTTLVLTIPRRGALSNSFLPNPSNWIKVEAKELILRISHRPLIISLTETYFINYRESGRSRYSTRYGRPVIWVRCRIYWTATSQVSWSTCRTSIDLLMPWRLTAYYLCFTNVKYFTDEEKEGKGIEGESVIKMPSSPVFRNLNHLLRPPPHPPSSRSFTSFLFFLLSICFLYFNTHTPSHHFAYFKCLKIPGCYCIIPIYLMLAAVLPSLWLDFDNPATSQRNQLPNSRFDSGYSSWWFLSS